MVEEEKRSYKDRGLLAPEQLAIEAAPVTELREVAVKQRRVLKGSLADLLFRWFPTDESRRAAFLDNLPEYTMGRNSPLDKHAEWLAKRKAKLAFKRRELRALEKKISGVPVSHNEVAKQVPPKPSRGGNGFVNPKVYTWVEETIGNWQLVTPRDRREKIAEEDLSVGGKIFSRKVIGREKPWWVVINEAAKKLQKIKDDFAALPLVEQRTRKMILGLFRQSMDLDTIYLVLQRVEFTKRGLLFVDKKQETEATMKAMRFARKVYSVARKNNHKLSFQQILDIVNKIDKVKRQQNRRQPTTRRARGVANNKPQTKPFVYNPEEFRPLAAVDEQRLAQRLKEFDARLKQRREMEAQHRAAKLEKQRHEEVERAKREKLAGFEKRQKLIDEPLLVEISLQIEEPASKKLGEKTPSFLTENKFSVMRTTVDGRDNQMIVQAKPVRGATTLYKYNVESGRVIVPTHMSRNKDIKAKMVYSDGKLANVTKTVTILGEEFPVKAKMLKTQTGSHSIYHLIESDYDFFIGQLVLNNQNKVCGVIGKKYGLKNYIIYTENTPPCRYGYLPKIELIREVKEPTKHKSTEQRLVEQIESREDIRLPAIIADAIERTRAFIHAAQKDERDDSWILAHKEQDGKIKKYKVSTIDEGRNKIVTIPGHCTRKQKVEFDVAKRSRLSQITNYVSIFGRPHRVERIAAQNVDGKEDNFHIISTKASYISGQLVVNSHKEVCAMICQKMNNGSYVLLEPQQLPMQEAAFTATDVVIGGNGINCDWTYNTLSHQVNSKCVVGTLNNGAFTGNITCLCKGSNNWSHLNDNCPKDRKPKRHIVGRRFGGAKHGYNCFFNTPAEEILWTRQEDEIQSQLLLDRTCKVVMDSINKYVKLNCTLKYHLTEIETMFGKLDSRFEYVSLVVEGKLQWGVMPKEACRDLPYARHVVNNFSDRGLSGYTRKCDLYYTVSKKLGKQVKIGHFESECTFTVSEEPIEFCCLRANYFESGMDFVSGTPIFNEDGEIVSVITYSIGNRYAIITSECAENEIKISVQYRITENDLTWDTITAVGKTWVEGRYFSDVIITPMHSLTSSIEMKETHHHYVDFFSKILLNKKLGQKVHIGSPTSSNVRNINRDVKVLTYGYDGQQLHYQVAYTFQHCDDLLSGTPLYNEEGQLISVITASKGNKYVIANFYGPRGRVSCNRYKKVDLEPGILYAGRRFDNKQELVNYIKGCRSISTTTTLYIVNVTGTNTTRLILERGGLEIFHIYLDYPCVDIFHMGDKKPESTGAIKKVIDSITGANRASRSRTRRGSNQRDLSTDSAYSGATNVGSRGTTRGRGRKQVQLKAIVIKHEQDITLLRSQMDTIIHGFQNLAIGSGHGQRYRAVSQSRDSFRAETGMPISSAPRRGRGRGMRKGSSNVARPNANQTIQSQQFVPSRGGTSNRRGTRGRGRGIPRQRSRSLSTQRNNESQYHYFSPVTIVKLGTVALLNSLVWQSAEAYPIRDSLAERIKSIQRESEIARNRLDHIGSLVNNIYKTDSEVSTLVYKYNEDLKCISGNITEVRNMTRGTFNETLSTIDDSLKIIKRELTGYIDQRTTLSEIVHEVSAKAFDIMEGLKMLNLGVKAILHKVEENFAISKRTINLLTKRSEKSLFERLKLINETLYATEDLIILAAQAKYALPYEGTIARDTYDLLRIPEASASSIPEKILDVKHVDDKNLEKNSRSKRSTNPPRTSLNRWYLGNQDSEADCSTIDLSLNKISKLEKACTSSSTEKYLGLSNSSCAMGYTNIVYSGNHYVAEPYTGEFKMRCSLSCLSSQELLMLLAKQPLTWNCVNPLLQLITKVENFEWVDVHDEDNLDIYFDVIFVQLSNKTLMLKHQTYVSDDVCKGAKLMKYGENDSIVFKDGLFKCTLERSSLVRNKDDLIKWVIEKLRPIDVINTMLGTVTGAFLSRHFGLLFGGAAFVLLTYASPVFSDENILSNCLQSQRFVTYVTPVGLDSGKYNYEVRAEVRKNHCINLGNMRVLKFKNLTVQYVYNFEYATPSSVEVDCCIWDYNCPSQTNSICATELECCKTGLNESKLCVHYCGGQKTTYDTTCWRSGSMNVRVESRLALPTAKEKYLYVYKVQMFALSREVLIEDRVGDVKKEIKVKQGYDTIDETGLLLYSMEVSETPHYRYIVKYNGEWWCANINVAEDICKSTNLVKPWKVVDKIKCRNTFVWTDWGYKCQMPESQIMETLGKQLVPCPSNVRISEDSQSVVANYDLDTVYVHMRSNVRVNTALLTACEKVVIESVDIEPGNSEFYKISIITIRGTSSGKCMIVVDLSPCYIVSNPQLDVFNEFESKIEVLCGINYPADIVVRLKNGKLYKREIGQPLIRDLNFFFEAKYSTVKGIVMTYNTTGAWNIFAFVGSPFAWLYNLLDFMAVLKWGMIIGFGYLITMSLLYGNVIMASLLFALATYMLGGMFGVQSLEIDHQLNLVITNMYRVIYEVTPATVLPNRMTCALGIDNILDALISIIGFRGCSKALKDSVLLAILLMMWTFSMLDKNLILSLKRLWNRKNSTKRIELKKIRAISWYISAVIPNREWGSYNPLAITPYVFHRRRAGESLMVYGNNINCNDREKLSYDDVSKVYKWADAKFKDEIDCLKIAKIKGQCVAIIRRNAYTFVYITDHQLDLSSEKPKGLNIVRHDKAEFVSFVELDKFQAEVSTYLGETKLAKNPVSKFQFILNEFSEDESVIESEVHIKCQIEGGFLVMYVYQDGTEKAFKRSWKGLSGIILEDENCRIFVVQAKREEQHKLVLEPYNILPKTVAIKKRDLLQPKDLAEICTMIEMLEKDSEEEPKSFFNLMYDNINVGIYSSAESWFGVVHSQYIDMDEFIDKNIICVDNGTTVIFNRQSLREVCNAYLQINGKISLNDSCTEMTKRTVCFDSTTGTMRDTVQTFEVEVKCEQDILIIDFGDIKEIDTMLEGSFMEFEDGIALLEVVYKDPIVTVKCKCEGFWRASVSDYSINKNRMTLKEYNRIVFDEAPPGVYWSFSDLPESVAFYVLTNNNQNLSDLPKQYDKNHTLKCVDEIVEEDIDIALDVTTSLAHLESVVDSLEQSADRKAQYIYLRTRNIEPEHMRYVYHAGNYYVRKSGTYRMPPIPEIVETQYNKMDLFGVILFYTGSEIPFENAIRWMENNKERNPIKDGKMAELRFVKWSPDQETGYVIHWYEDENIEEQKIIVHNSDITVGNENWAIRLIIVALQWDKNIHIKFDDATACARFIKTSLDLPIWDIVYEHRLSVSVTYDPENMLDRMIEGIEREENTLSWPRNAEAWRNIDKTTFTTIVEKGAMSKGTNVLKVEELEGNLVPSFLQPGKFGSVLLSTGTGISRASIVGKDIVTNLHCVNKGNIVYTNMKEYQHSENPTTYVWSKPRVDARTDVAIFGEFEFSEPIKNNLYAMIDLINGKTLYMLCRNIANHVNGEKGAYSTFVPVDVDFNKRTMTLKKWEKKSGLSGSPIIDEKGNIVAVYGVSLSVKEGGETVQYTTLAQPVVTKFDYANYFRNCAQEVARKDLPDDKQYFLLVAPTGTGKTITFTRSLAECLDYNGVIVLLEPTVAAAYNAFDAFRSWLTTENLDNKFELSIQVGQRNLKPNDTFGTGAKKISIYTAGKFAVDLKDILREATYILVDEAHARNDETVCLSQLLLARKAVYGKKVGESCRVIYMTATEIEFSKWGYTLGTVEKIPDTRYPIREERLLPCTGDTKVDGLINLNLSNLAKDVNWQNNYKLPYEELSLGRAIIFVHKVKAAQRIAEQIKKQYPELNVVPYYAGCSVNLATIPQQCIIVSTDVLGVSVTIPNCTCVVDLGLELKPSVVLTRSKNESGYNYQAKLVERVITKQSADQRKGRTGRTCAGVYYCFPIDLESQVMWDTSVMTKVAFKAMLTVGKTHLEYTNWCNDLQFDEARVILLEYSWMHPEFNVPESCNIHDRVKLASEADGDQLELYLRTVISKEWLRKQQSSKEDDLPFHHMSKASANIEWSRRYFETFKLENIVESQDDVRGRMELLRKFVTSEFNDTPDMEWNRLLDVRLLCYSAEQRNGFLRRIQKINKSLDRPTSTKLDLLNVTESTTGASSDIVEPFEKESYLGVCGVTALLGTVCVLGMAANYQIDKFGNRYIIEMHSVEQSELPRIARHSPQFTKEHSEMTGFIEMQISRIKRWIIQKWEFVKKLIHSILGIKKNEKKIESAHALQFVDEFADWLQHKAPGIFTNVNMAATALGGITAYCVDDFVKTFGSIPAAICIAGISMITTVVAGIYPAAGFVVGSCILYVMTRSDSSRSLIRNEYAGKCGKLLMGAGVSGVLIGGVYYNQLAKLLERSNFQSIGLLTAAPIVEVPWYRKDIAPSRSVLAASKQLYFLCMSLVRKEIDKAAFATNLMALGFNVGMGGFFHFAYVTMATLALFGGKYMVEKYQDNQILKAGELKQSQAYTDISKRWQHIPEWYDEFVAVLGLIGNPLSIVSIVLRYLSIWLMEGDIDENKFRTIFKETAGVGLLITIVRVVFEWIALAQDTLDRESVSLWEGIKNLIFKKIPESINDLICRVKNWFSNAISKYSRIDKTSVSDSLAARFNDGMAPSLVGFHTEVLKMAKDNNIPVSDELLTAILNMECASEGAMYTPEIKNLIIVYCVGIKATLSPQEKELAYKEFFLELGEYEEVFAANKKKGILRKIYDWLLYAIDWLKQLAINIWNHTANFCKNTYLKFKNNIGEIANNAGREFRRGLGGQQFEPEFDIQMMNTTDWNSYCTNTVSEATKGMKDLVRYMSENMVNGSELIMTLATQSCRTDPVFGSNSFEKVNYKNFGTGATLWASIDTVLPLFLFKQKEYGLIRVLSILGPVKIVDDHVVIDLYGSKYEATAKVSWTQSRVIVEAELLSTKLYVVLESINEEKTKANLLLHGPQAYAISKMMLAAEFLMQGIIVGTPHFIEVTNDPVTQVTGTTYGIFGQLGAWWNHTGRKITIPSIMQAPFNFAISIFSSSLTKKYGPLSILHWIQIAENKLRGLPIVDREEVEKRFDQLWIYLVSDKLDEFIDKLQKKELPAIKFRFENNWNLYEFEDVPEKYQKFTLDDDKIDMTEDVKVVAECLIKMHNIRYNILPERMDQPFPRLKTMPSVDEMEAQDENILRWSLHTGVSVTRISRETASLTSVLGNCNCMVYYYIETGFIRIKQGIVGGRPCHHWKKDGKAIFPDVLVNIDLGDSSDDDEDFCSPDPTRPSSVNGDRGQENLRALFVVGFGMGVSYWLSSFISNSIGSGFIWCYNKWKENRKAKSIYKQMDYVYVDLEEFERTFKASGQELQCLAHCLFLTNDTGEAVDKLKPWLDAIEEHIDDLCSRYAINRSGLEEELRQRQNYGLATITALSAVSGVPFHVRAQFDKDKSIIVRVNVMTKQHPICLIHEGSHWDRIKSKKQWHQEHGFPEYSNKAYKQIQPQDIVLKEIENRSWFAKFYLMATTWLCFAKSEDENKVKGDEAFRLFDVSVNVQTIDTREKCESVIDKNKKIFDQKRQLTKKIQKSVEALQEAIAEGDQFEDERSKLINRLSMLPSLKPVQTRELEALEMFQPAFDILTTGVRNSVLMLRSVLSQFTITESTSKKIACKVQDISLSMIDFDIDIVEEPQPVYETEAIVSKDGKVSYMRNMNEISPKSTSLQNKYWHDTALSNLDREILVKNAVVETVFYQAQHRMKTQLATLPKYVIEKVKYAERVEPPSSARGCDATVYASKTATQWQLLYEEYPELFTHAQVMFDVACGAGGFLQFMSWLGSTKGQPRRLVYYNTLMTEKHAKPLLNQVVSPNSLTDLISCISEERDSDLRSKEVIRKFLQVERPDFILFDCVENSKKNSWHLKPRTEIGLCKIESEPEYSNFIKDYMLGDIRVGEIVAKSFQGDITAAVQEGVVMHCISSDWALEKGLAQQLDRVWNLTSRKVNVDKVTSDLTIVSLETKTKKNEKPTLLNLFKQLRKYLREFEGQTQTPIYVPALGCGLDKLNFSHVAHMLQWFTQNYGLDITIVDERFNALVQTITIVETHLSAMLKYIELLNNGGTAVVRFIGYDRNLPGVISMLSSKFKKLACWRSPTSPNDSLVWYLICTSYDKNYTRTNVHKLAEIIHPLRCELTNICEFTYTTAKFHKKFLNRSIKKYDWFEPKMGEVLIYKNQSVIETSEPPAFIFNVTGEFGKPIQIHWKPEFRKRLGQITDYANCNRFDGKFKILPQGKTWKELICLGSYVKGKVPYEKTRKWITNGLIADGLNTVFGITPANASYAFTQHTESFTEASYNQRLDRNPGLPDKRYALDLLKAMECLKTKYAHSIEKKCRYLSAEETLYLMRNRGAVGKLDNGGTLEQWAQLHPDWYEAVWRDRIVPWSEGRTTDCYFTMRNKKESKKRKDCDDETGRLNYQIGAVTDQELLLNGDMVPRQITFADAKTRLAQIVMLGDLITKHGNNKVYKGSITGTPPQYQGRVLKTLWKYHEGKVEDSVYDSAMDVLVALKEGAKISSGRTCALVIDFSKFDFTQTLVDRVAENEFFASFYEDAVIADAIIGSGRDFGYSIVLNDHGDVVGKEGMRASGELPTSIGNTLQANAHLRVAIARSLGISIEDLCETQGEMYFYVGGGFGPDPETCRDIHRLMCEANKELPILSEGMCKHKKFKKIELQRISVVCDGDDCIVLGNWDDIHRIKNSICEEVEFGKKILRSGDKAGVGFVSNFNNLSFCSHEYRFAMVSRVPMDTHFISEQNYAVSSQYHTDDYKVYYLQTRNSCLSLGKMANTLKIITQKWDPTNEEAVNITRGKLASYLLLYPHLRVVREFTLSALAIAGEGKLDLSGLWSFNDVPYDDSTLLNALFSLYGVRSLDQITYTEYKEEIKSLYDIKYNARLIGKNCPIRISDVRFNCYNWITSNNARVDTRILQLNTQTANFFFKMKK